MKRIIFTANINNYDELEIPFVPNGWDFLLFTESGLNTDPQRQARHIKLCPHLYFEFDEAIWIDSNAILKSDLIFNVDFQFVSMKHPHRSCVYDEINACKKYQKANHKELDKQIKNYASNGLPCNTGLISSGLNFRKNTKKVAKFCEKWFSHIKRFTARDQLSFSYLAWKHDFKYQTIPYCVEILRKHKKG
ncbi:MAG TPA: DUF616 domain-containing protein [Candidatus Methanofastidiosum sp.]|jgi:hypothetical protein|nr:DUF616 domain-containing protein [Methanofastidiosum sp.]